MPFELSTFLILILLGGVIAVDGTSVGQFMISRPFVAASLAGWVVGDPVSGAAIGLVLEAFHLTVLPVGAAKYPEGGPAALSGAAVFAAGSGSAPSAMLLTILMAIGLEYVGGESVRYLRQYNVRLITIDHRPELTAAALERRHWLAIGLDYLRGCGLVVFGVGIISLARTYVFPYWGFGEELPRLLLIGVMGGLLASTVALLGSRFWFALTGALVTAGFLILQQ